MGIRGSKESSAEGGPADAVGNEIARHQGKGEDRTKKKKKPLEREAMATKYEFTG